MIKQRRELVDLYRKGGREELAAVEEAEIAVIERFLPAQMSDAEAEAAIHAIIAETGASSMKDMGRVMAAVKERLGSQHRAGAGERPGQGGAAGERAPRRVAAGGELASCERRVAWSRLPCQLVEHIACAGGTGDSELRLRDYGS